MDYPLQKILPLKKLMAHLEKPDIRKISKEQILLQKFEPRPTQLPTQDLNINNSSLTININIDANNLGSTIKDISGKVTKLAIASFAGIAALGAAATFLNNNKKSRIINPNVVKLPPIPQVRLPKF